LPTFEVKDPNDMKLVFATNNDHKIKEITQVLGDEFELLNLKDINLYHDIPEKEKTLEGNALAKARYVCKLGTYDVFADDTGLEVDALGGKPGVLSARYAGETKSSEANISKLLKELKDNNNRKAKFRTVIALILDGREYLFEGIIAGSIITEMRGINGFGYDPVFRPENESRTFAEMALSEKSLISHRAIAIGKLVKFLRQ
jgi:XTP/dITP diphosphohydrolase